MPSLDPDPIVQLMLPILAIALLAALACMGVYVGLQLAARRRPKRRRPEAASPRRSMIVVDRRGQPMLQGQALANGDIVDLRLPAPSGPEWAECPVRRSGDAWFLVLPNRQTILAVGQMARWPLLASSPDETELKRRLRRCKYRCPQRRRLDWCSKNCEVYSEKRRLEANENTPQAIRKLL